MKPLIRIFPTAGQLAEELASVLMQRIQAFKASGSNFNIMLPGGNTPRLLFGSLARKSSKSTAWDHVRIFWGDERCVPPTDPESNYRMAKESLLDHCSIPEKNVHRIHGEDDPFTEARRYAGELRSVAVPALGNPVFDMVLLGVGEDGHTASIFPDRMDLLHSSELCEVSVHPVTGQKRITVTGELIGDAAEVIFIVTGKNKAGVVAEILEKTEASGRYPAAHIRPAQGTLTWLLDRDAAIFLTDKEKEYVKNS
jgi:6-phosphogluconolactonase